MKQSVNPYNQEVLYEFDELRDPEIDRRLQLAQEAFEATRSTTFADRAELMRNVADQLRSESRVYAKTISLEMGKPITQAIAEVEKCAWVCDYYAENAEGHLRAEPIATDADTSYVSYEPLGVILAVMPWNYPFWQVFRFAAPALMAGNVAVLKHASNVMKSAGNIQEIFETAGFQEGCFQNLIVGSEAIEALIRNKIIKAVTLTGSKPAGSSVAATAGREIKKTVLELGGSNALIVFDDAEMESTLETCLEARFQNTGQSCIAGKRLLLQKRIAKEFTARFTDMVSALKAGNPQDKDTYIGVLAREDLAIDLEKQVNESVDMGAKILVGGKRKGSFFEPSLIGGVTPDMPLFREETFGPAIGITVFESEEEAVALSNASDFGLGVSVFTSSAERTARLVPQFNEGAVFVNELVKSDPRLPFGGVKNSGYGRELSRHGILEFVNKKTVFIKNVQ